MAKVKQQGVGTSEFTLENWAQGKFHTIVVTCNGSVRMNRAGDTYTIGEAVHGPGTSLRAANKLFPGLALKIGQAMKAAPRQQRVFVFAHPDVRIVVLKTKDAWHADATLSNINEAITQLAALNIKGKSLMVLPGTGSGKLPTDAVLKIVNEKLPSTYHIAAKPTLAPVQVVFAW